MILAGKIRFVPSVLMSGFLLFFLFLSPVGSFAEASGTTIDGLLPPAGFLEGWAMEGKAELFSRETLYELINGEAELYLPYGFEALASAYYGRGEKAGTSLSVHIYQMGSVLDAFGIYSNYRAPEEEVLKIGVDGCISTSQVMFYQDRYFVRLSASTGTPDRQAFIACAEAISKKLPAPPVAPGELEILKTPDVTPRTEKFVAESLLGYKFFSKGLTAEATLEGKPVKFFVVLTESEAAAKTTLDHYVEYLRKEGNIPQMNVADGKTLVAKDPLYKGVLLRQSGRCLLGIAKLEDPLKGFPFLDRWVTRLSLK